MYFNSATCLALGLVAVSCISTVTTANTIYFYPSETEQPQQPQQLFARDAATADFSPKISGGQPVPSNELKYVAFIQAVQNSMGATCTGSLIAPNVVLTAAHCLYRNSTQVYTAKEFQVGFTHKTPDVNKRYEGYSVSKIIYLSSFNIKSLKADIAIILLTDKVPASVATPVQIYTGDFDQDTPVLAAGYGLTNATDKNSIPKTLMQVPLTIGSDEYCKSKSGTYDPKVQICTDGTPGKDTCRGDSGGPLLTPVDSGKYALLGLTSFTPINSDNPNGLCAQPKGSGVYTHVAPYINWIAQYANLNATEISITNTTVPSTSSEPISESSSIWLSSDSESTDASTSTSTEYIYGEPSIIYASLKDSLTNNGLPTRFMLASSVGYAAIGATMAMLIALA
ncbi:hypothetical protein GGF42_001138 [Coemansia sp. RSA 2424]|nr:hypothetical protein GGF42_001138 [Coemansia sp. RSA 2424]